MGLKNILQSGRGKEIIGLNPERQFQLEMGQQLLKAGEIQLARETLQVAAGYNRQIVETVTNTIIEGLGEKIKLVIDGQERVISGAVDLPIRQAEEYGRQTQALAQQALNSVRRGDFARLNRTETVINKGGRGGKSTQITKVEAIKFRGSIEVPGYATSPVEVPRTTQVFSKVQALAGMDPHGHLGSAHLSNYVGRGGVHIEASGAAVGVEVAIVQNSGLKVGPSYGPSLHIESSD